MFDKGIDKGLIREINLSDRDKRGWKNGFFGFRKMFWDYLNKLNVPFYDACCEDAPTVTAPVRYNSETGTLQYFNGTAWTNLPFNAVNPTTTTTTTSTTTTTTAAPSDVRLKSNIRETGNSYTVLKEYSWDWNDEAKRLGLDHFPTTGILAQEALLVCPEIVSVGEDGFYRVDTGKLIKA